MSVTGTIGRYGPNGDAPDGRPAGRRIVVGLTGTPGMAYGVRLLEALRDSSVETHLVMCSCARDAIAAETGRDPEAVLSLAARTYQEWNQAARISSGSFLTAGMIVAPCSTRSLASIANGFANNLIHRAADVTIKEGRRLVLLVPEDGLGEIDVENVRRLGEVPGAETVPLPNGGDGLDATVAVLLDRFRLPGTAPSLAGERGAPAP